MNIVHQTGSSTVTNDYQIALSQRERLNETHKARYQVYDFLQFEDLNNILSQASLVLSRSGANTTQLVLYKGIPTVFMPLPWSSNNEQLENARIAEESGLTTTFEFKDGLMDHELLDVIKHALEQITQQDSFKPDITWEQAKKTAKSLARTDAADKIVDYVLS